MRKLLSALALVALALVVAAPAASPVSADTDSTALVVEGPSTPLELDPIAAAGCYYACGCNGQVLWCCGTSCKPATGNPPIQCPQDADC